MQRSYIIFILLLIVSLVTAQNNNIESVDVLLEELKLSQQDTSKVEVLNKLAIEFIGLDNKRASEFCYKALDLSKKIHHKEGLSQSYYNLAKCFYYQYEFDSVEYYYKISKDINSIKENWFTASSFASLVGLVKHIQSDYNNAIKYYNESLELSNKLNDKEGMAYCYNGIGAAYYDQGNYEKALENYFKSLAINEEIENTSMVARTLGNIGGIYEEQEKYSSALVYYERANVIAIKNDDKQTIAATYRNIGGIYAQNNKLDSSLIVYEKSLNIYEELDDIRGIVSMYNVFGQTYVTLTEIDEDGANKLDLFVKAIGYYNKSLEINNKDLNELEQKVISYQGIGEIYYYKNNLPLAIKHLDKARHMAKEIESVNNIKTAHKFLSLAYAKIRNFEKAYESHVLYKNLSDTLKSDENIEILTQASMQYEFDKQQKEQEFIQAQKELEYQQKQKRDRLIRIFILIGLVIVSGFSIQVLRSYQRKKKDNELLAQQNVEIEKQKEEITDSIRYAKRIQTAILPSNKWVNEHLPEHFVLFRPRDIVSGDYYWMNKIDNKVIVAAADCTGHGVPGAFMSMLGVSFLNEIVNKNNTVQPNLILNQLRNQVKLTLDQTGKEGEAKDGMDIAICVIDFDTLKLQYSGAYNPLYLYRDGELLETKADKMPIGIYIREKESFTNHEIQLQKGDTFYIFSDGYADQFGGPKGGKFKSRPFKALLGNIQSHSMVEQWEILESTIDDWRGDIDQIDDIIILGIRV